MPLKKLFILKLFFLSFLVFAIDQMFKDKIRSTGGFYLCNQGISFGLIIPSAIYWLIIAIFLLSSCFFFLFKAPPKIFTNKYVLALGLFGGGALSNIFDRTANGCVLDYFSLYPAWNFLPIFNFADVAIFLGSCLFILIILSKKLSHHA